MTQIDTLNTQGLLAMAAYADGMLPANLINIGMTSIQAADFASNWTVVDRYTDASGAAATVFKENATSKIYLAIRGTESPGDFNADYILALGFPSYLNPQFIQLHAQVGTWISNGTLPSGFTLTGHSLGGYLSAAIGTWFSGQSGEIYLYNAPGIGGPIGNALDAFRAAFGFSDTALVPGITSIRGTAGVSLISGLGAQLAPPLFIETESRLNPIDNHSIVGLTDSLAIYNLFATLDPALLPNSAGLTKITDILKTSGNITANILETALATVGKIFGKTYSTVETDRNDLYTHLNDLQTTLSSSSAGLLTVAPFASKATSDIVAQAKADLAYRYALKELAPFALTGDDGLYANFNATGELNRYDPASGTGCLTDPYLTDRAAMLSWKIRYDSGARDSDGAADDSFRVGDKAYSDKWDTEDIPGNWDFIDQGTLIGGNPLKLVIDGSGITFSDHQIVFGDSANNTLTGSGDTDRLYGGAGADTLTGGSAADYLEGGTGFDTYLINPGDGNDTLLDTDGLGSIVYNGIAITGGTSIGTGNWWNITTNVSYTLVATSLNTNDLLIDVGNEHLTVKDYTAGELGINFTGTIPIGTLFPDGHTSSGGIIYYGDRSPYVIPFWHPYLASPTWPYAFDNNSNIVRTIDAMPYWSDKVYDTPYDDNIYAGHGFNVIYADKGGNNYIEAGNNTDYITGGGGRDIVFSGGMTDTIDVAGGNDIVYGQDGGDVIEGGGGHDLLIGGASAGINTRPGDGGNGADAIHGGAGNDQLYADDLITWTDAITDNGIAAAGQGELLAGGADADTVVGGKTNDALLGGDGQDMIAGRAGDDIILGDSGVDFIVPPLSDFDDIIGALSWPMGPYINLHSPYSTAPMLGIQFMKIDNGASAANRFEVKLSSLANPEAPRGNWIVSAIAGDRDLLYGGSGNDWIFGEFGEDTLVGGTGDDVMLGGEGSDTYIVNAGEGVDIIADTLPVAGTNTLVFGAGVDQSLITLFEGSLGINLGNGNAVHIEGVDYDDIANTCSIGRFVFSDGTVLSAQQLVARGFEVTGGSGGDTLRGTNVEDRFDGGAGDDALSGGKGDDTYLFGLGSGQDTISDIDTTIGNSDTIRLKAGLSPDDVALWREGGNLCLGINGTSDRVTVLGWFDDPANWKVGSFSLAANDCEWRCAA